ncbi:hypothetical protein B7R54_08570 [Subtercola boreus]|uniref:Uncharacterized protein n=1 Tax=Subtercola boreus TaxID=120213 RepID=A0A3E0VI10_9MICO|nr:hypothetical protein [Subtercola boreus]RFA09275.1 hypothetical protein B7R54_08570 [Subtercola boreus]TQL53696.1 hypothetical protein FB464_1213 [Subtercola boreus]
MSSTLTSTLQSAGPLLFAPAPTLEGGAVLFAADVTRARVVAFELPAEQTAGEQTAEQQTAEPLDVAAPAVRVDQLGTKLASLLGVAPGDAVIRGIAVHPVSREVYLSIARGRGADAGPALVRAGADGQLSVVDVDELPATSFDLDDAPAEDDERKDVWLDGIDPGSAPREIHGVTLDIAQVPSARSSITDLAWIDGSLFVAGLSNEEFSSRLRQIPYPFDGTATGTSVEIFHVDHGKYETGSPIRALTPFDGGRGILATYTCTPVVHFTLDQLRGEGLVRGRTVAELGPMNQPFSLVSYDRDGEEFLLVSNTRHPLLKIPVSSIAGQEPLHLGLSDDGSSLGVPRENLDHPGVTWMASLDRANVVVVQEEGGDIHLRTLGADEL